MLAIVTGMIGTYPVGGVAWDYGQYVIGLEELGFDVFYLEDTGGPTYDPISREYGDDCSYGLQFLNNALTQLSPRMARRWHFRSAAGELFGLTATELNAAFAQAELFLNVSGSALLRDEYAPCRRKVLIDTDPGWNHFVNYPRWDANPGWQGTHGYRGHDYFFTYAERIGTSDCILPTFGLKWHPTRPLISIDRWGPADSTERWTTVMTWNNFRQPVEFQGRQFGTKEMEFGKIEGVPRKLPEYHFEVATGGSGAPTENWKALGWNVLDSHAVSATLDAYRDYICGSRGELSVAKNLYTATHSGWFSCRSACYLAAGRPVVIQDTGYSKILPAIEGLLAFSNETQAIEAISAIESNYPKHSRAAREIASEYLATSKVLGDLLAKAGL